METREKEYERVLSTIKDKRQRLIDGKLNCIPFGLERFESILPGIEQKEMVIVTASTKVGKTQLTDFMYLYQPLFYALEHPQIRVKIFYFTLEMSKEQKYMQMMSHLLFRLSKGKIRATPRDLRSVYAGKPIRKEVIETLESDEYRRYLEFFESHVEFIDSIRNPFGIYKVCREYALLNGTQHKKKMILANRVTNEKEEKEIDDFYEPNDPDEYVIIIVDHLSLLTAEQGKSQRESMIGFTSDYCLTLRNKYHYIPVIVQQQAMAQEGIENFKLNKLRPSIDGLGDDKLSARDADLILGLFSPIRYGIRLYEGYDITKFKDNIRFLELIAGREGGNGTLCPLLFDGGTNYFSELPKPDDTEQINGRLDLIGRVNNGIVMMTYSEKSKKAKVKAKKRING